MAKFKDVICCIKNGGTAWRMSWAKEGDKEIMMQIPQCISKDIVPKMTSVQESIKPKISTVGSGEIEYHDQVIIITFTDDGKTPARATYYIPTWEDIFAEDWMLSRTEDTYYAQICEELEELVEKDNDFVWLFKTTEFANLKEEEQANFKRQHETLSKYIEALDEELKLRSEISG